MKQDSDSTPKKKDLSAEEINLHQIDDKIFRATMQNKDALTLFLTEFPIFAHQCAARTES